MQKESDRLASIEASGATLCSTRSAGRIGEWVYSGPILNVAVYPGGFIVRPPLARARTLLIDEVEEIRWQGGWEHGLRIAHRSRDLASPLTIRVGHEHRIVKAMADLLRLGRPDLLDANGNVVRTRGSRNVLWLLVPLPIMLLFGWMTAEGLISIARYGNWAGLGGVLFGVVAIGAFGRDLIDGLR